MLVSFSFSLFTFHFSLFSFHFITSCASHIMCVHIHAPRKSMQRYYFFLTWPNIRRKKCHFSAKIVHFSLLFSFCYFDFAKSALVFDFFSSPPFCHKSAKNNHLYTFSTTHFYLLKTLVFSPSKSPFFIFCYALSITYHLRRIYVGYT